MRGTAEYDVADFEDRTRGDKNTLVRFFIRPVLNEAKSAKEGRPIYEDKEYCEIHVPGNQTNVPIKPVNSIIKQRFGTQYARWKETGEADFVEGTVLSEVPWLSRSQVEELAYLKIRTLEQLAGVGDEVCSRTMGLTELKRRAKLFLDASKDGAVITQLEKSLQERDALIQIQKQQLESLTARIEALEAEEE